MKKLEYSGEGKVNGSVFRAYLAAFGPYMRRGEQILCDHLGVKELSYTADAWYSLKTFLNTLEDVGSQFGDEFIKKIGEGVFASAIFPSEIDSFEKAIAVLNEIYFMNHRAKSEEIGGYSWTAISDNKGELICDNPYPCKFDEGILQYIARVFSPKAQIIHKNGKPCRHGGGESCHFVIEW